METLVRVRWSTSPSTHRSTPVAAWTPEGRKGAGQHRQAVLPGSRRFQAFDLPLGGFDSAGSTRRVRLGGFDPRHFRDALALFPQARAFQPPASRAACSSSAGNGGRLRGSRRPRGHADLPI